MKALSIDEHIESLKVPGFASAKCIEQKVPTQADTQCPIASSSLARSTLRLQKHRIDDDNHRS
eukprot:6013746-Amphidinium_carterae.1